MSEKNTRSRSWFIVCPNIRDNGVASITPDTIKQMTEQAICDSFVEEQMGKYPKGSAACIYCKSAEGMEHLHIVLCNNNALAFTSIKKFLGPKAHIEPTKGNKEQVEAYIKKLPPYDEKGEVILSSSQHGELIGKQGKRNDLEYIKACIESGMNWKEVRRQDPKFFDSRYTNIIRTMFVDYRERMTPQINDNMKVEWHFGLAGSGKSRTFRLIDRSDCYVVTSYEHPFDSYCGQETICFDEYKGQFRYSDLLVYTDRYQIDLPCRYSNLVSCWSKVVFTSVYIPDALYAKMVSQSDQGQDTLDQLLRRITDYYWHFFIVRADGRREDFAYHFTPDDYARIKADTYTKNPDDIKERIKAYALNWYMGSDNYRVDDDMTNLM